MEQKVYLFCPLCGKPRRKASNLVCPECYERYTHEAAIELASSNVYSNLYQWVLKEAEKILPELEKEYVQAKKDFEDSKEAVNRATLEELKKATNGKPVPREVWLIAFRQKKQEIWRDAGGNKLFATMKTLENRISFLKEILAGGTKQAEGKVISFIPKQ